MSSTGSSGAERCTTRAFRLSSIRRLYRHYARDLCSDGIGFAADASVNNLAQIAPGVNLGARISAGYIPNVFSIAAAPVATFSFQDGGIWVGPSVALAIANRTNIGFGLTTGVEYNVNQQIMVFGGLYLGVVPSVAGIVTAGVNHQ